MKQRITVGQLKKLTDGQKGQLREWWKPQYGDAYYYPKVDSTGNVPNGYKGWEIDDMKTRVLPLLSIGQMIQFIEEYKPIKSIAKNRFGKWFVNIDTAMLGHKDELCDTLWEATTQILKAMK